MSSSVFCPYCDVSQGKLVTTDNYYSLFNGLLNPRQIEGLRLLLNLALGTQWTDQEKKDLVVFLRAL